MYVCAYAVCMCIGCMYVDLYISIHGQSAFRVRPTVNGDVRFRSAVRGRGGAFQALLDCVSYRPRCVSGPAPPERHKSEAPEATRYKPS